MRVTKIRYRKICYQILMDFRGIVFVCGMLKVIYAKRDRERFLLV